jgi:hypothetical protein
MKALLLIGFSLISIGLGAQQLIIEAFGDWNKTNYDKSDFVNKSKFFGYGARLGFGADHVQVGGEFRSNLSDPTFLYGDGNWSFDETYVGGFLRTKISRYPAMRFGLVLRGGLGVYNTTAKLDSIGVVFQNDYKPILGFNAGIGFSTPIYKYAQTMIEFGYTLNYAPRPEIFLDDNHEPVPAHNGMTHLISIGLSYNFVFGKRAENYQHARENWKFRNGWQG